MPAIPEHDRPLIECLHQLVFDDAECRAAIESGLQRAAQQLSDPKYCKSYASAPIAIAPFTAGLPAALRGRVRLCRAFTIKAGERAPHEEIHRNSTQRLVSFRGSGAVNCAQPGGSDRCYTRYQIRSPDNSATCDADIEACWDVVPENTWHFPEARGSGQWYGVAFHSASAEDIVDEYVDCATQG